MVRRWAIILWALVAATPAGIGVAGPIEQPAGMSLSIEAPETYMAGRPITVSGYLLAFAAAPVLIEVSRGVTNAPVEVFVNDVRVKEATTSIDGSWQVELQFGPDPPTVRTIHAVAFGHIAPLTTRSSQIETRLARILLELEVDPPSAAVAVGATVRLRAFGLFDDGRTSDVSERAEWSASNRGVASVSNEPGFRGVVTGVSPGTTTITAMMEGRNATATVTVSA